MKNCIQCGAVIPDGSKRLCAECARRRALASKSEWAKKFRAEQRKKNAETRQRCKDQQTEIEQLRKLVTSQRERLKALEAERQELKQQLNDIFGKKVRG